MGAREDASAYKLELEQVFDEVIGDICISGTGSDSAKNKLKDLRTRHDISYTDEAGILEAIIDRAGEQSLTYDEAQFYFELLQDGKLMEYRQDAYRQKSELHLRELLSLLQQQLELAGSGGESEEELSAVLNNYYDIVGLEYDEQYFRLSNLILSLKEGRITAQEMMTGLDSMNQQLIQLSNREQTEKNNRQQISEEKPQTQDGNQQQTQTNNQQGAEHNASESSTPPANSGTGNQTPPKTGTSTHR